MKVLELNSQDKVEEQVYSSRLFYEELLCSIKNGLKNDDLIVPIINVKFDDKEFQIKSHRNEWNMLLQKGIDYFISTEEYEICSEIKNLLDID